MLSNIEVARASNALPNACPFCGSLALFVVESRPLPKGGRRRRKRCDRCAEKFTTYEISQEEYKALKKGKKVHPIVVAPKDICSNCIHWGEGNCDLGFPESVDVRFASECSCYQGTPEA